MTGSEIPFESKEENRLSHDTKDFDEDVYTMVIDDLIGTLDPNDYFITSGEAIQKVKQLEKDAWRLAGEARKLVKLMEQAKGSAKYLEVTWEEGILTLKRKNPRKKSRHSQNLKAKKSTKKKTV